MAELHIPCAVNEVIGTSQLIQRIEMGVSPSVMLKSAPSKKVAKEMSNLLKGMSPGQMVAFDVGEINDKKDLGPIIEYIADTLQKHPGRVAPEMGAKASSAIGYEKYTGVYAPYSLEEFKGAQKNNLDAMGKVQEQLERHGITLSLENRPRPNYAFFPNGDFEGIPQETTSRFGGEKSKWSPFAQNIGTLLASGQEIKRAQDLLPPFMIQLDFEHLAQVSEYGNSMNLENADEGKIYAQDLNQHQQESLRRMGVDIKQKNPVANYEDITDEEFSFAKEWGFVMRKGQPTVHLKKSTLEWELGMLEGMDIGSVTPGFQAYMSYDDIQRGEHVLRIGSHLPGVTQEAFHDGAIREKWIKETQALHAFYAEWMGQRGIRDIEIEYQVGDSTSPIYEGEQWKRQTEQGMKQLLGNLNNSQTDEKDLPFYVK